MKSLFLNLFVLVFFNSIYCQTCNILSDDYSNPSLWTKYSATGSNEIFVANGRVNYVKSIDGKDERLLRALSRTLNSNDDWEIEVDFLPISGAISNYSGHEILALTAGSLNPLSICPDPKKCSLNWSPQIQDGIIIMFGTNHPPTNKEVNTFFSLHVKKGIGEIKSTNFNPIQVIYADIGLVYHLNLLKCGNTIELHVSSNGSPLPGSPITYQIPGNVEITGLNTIQHANSARGVDKRVLTAQIDNLCINSRINNAPSISGISHINSTVYNTKLYSCQGNQCFYVYTKDADNTQSLKLNVISGLPPGAVFTTSPGPRPVGKICWNPGVNNIGVHTIQMEVVDDYCAAKSQIKSFTIEVVSGYNLGGPIRICENYAPLSLPDPGPGVWSINSPIGSTIVGNTLDPSLYSPGKYTLTYCTPKPGFLSQCEGCWSIQLDILESPNIIFDLFEGICDTDAPRMLTAHPAGGTWSGGPYINSNGLFDPSLASTVFGNKVTYTVVLPNGCFDSRTRYILVHENGLGMSYDLGTHCEDEFLVLHEGGYKYELVDVMDLSGNGPPQNIPILPFSLPGNTIHFSYISNYINQTGNYRYFFRAWFRNNHGCEYFYEYTIKIVSCSCSDTVAQNITIQASPNPNFLKYDFSFTPTFGAISNIIRYKWVITDVNRNIIKTLNYWDNTYPTPGSSSFTYDFTSEFGSLFSCNNYDVYLQVLSQNSTEELSLCQTLITIPICDVYSNQYDSNVKKKTKKTNGYFTDVTFFPTSCENDAFLSFELNEESTSQIEVYNMLGRRLLIIPETTYKSGFNKIRINCQEIEKGLCFIRISDGIDSKSIKFVVK